ncbi:helix-turn-helix domain-containing protein [Brucella pituitosa]
MFYARSTHVEAGIKRRKQAAKAAQLLLVCSQTADERAAKAAQEQAIADALAKARAEAEAEYLAKLEAAKKEAEANKEAAIIKAFAMMGKEVPDDRRRTWREIAEDICEQSDYSVRCILSRDRNYEITAVRNFVILAIWAEREDLSLPRIGQLLGGRDHTTILHSLQKFGFKNREQAHAFVRKCLADGVSAKEAAAICKAA